MKQTSKRIRSCRITESQTACRKLISGLKNREEQVNTTGLYLNPGNEAFRQAATDDIYVDKTGMIDLLNQKINKSRGSAAQNDMTTFKTKDDILTLLIHLGYLAFEESTEEAFIPNREIAQEFVRSVKTGGWDGLIQALERSDTLLKRTWALDGEAVAKGIAAIHSETTSMLKYDNEPYKKQ